MKTKLLLWAVTFILSKSFYAQITPTAIGPSDQVDQYSSTLLLPFTELDKTKIETGILLDAGIEFADLKKYNGVSTDSSFTNSKIINDIYGTLVMSKISSNGGTLKSPADFQMEWFQAQTIDLIPIGGAYFKYNQISESNQLAFKNRTSEFTENRTSNISTSSVTITPQNKIIDVYANGVWQNPYDINQVFAMAPIAGSHNKLNFNVVFPPTLFLSNFSNEVSQMEVKFSDTGNFQAVNFGQMIPVHYTSAGEYTWTYKLTLSNGQILYSKNKFSVSGDLEKYVDIDNQSQAFSPTGNLSGNQYWKVQLENYQYFIPFPPTVVNKPKLTLYIKLRAGQTQITKPFIVAEGFDSGHITAPRQEGGDNTIETFLNNVNEYSQLGIKLNEYDIIYVDWGIGTDYIQNNAELMKKAIRWVNQNKVGNAKNIVIGQSMGGLVARFALKDMEDNGENHDTELFISHDSPHLGANTPLSIQFMLRNISKAFLTSPIVAGINYVFTPIFTGGAPISEALTLADTPASRQMLINYVDSNYNINNSVHNTWQAILKAKGYPQLTRNVAISNGSECGTDQNLQDLVTMHHSSKGWFIDFVGALIGGLTLDADQILLSLVPGKSRYYYDFVARPMINLNESKQLYTGKIVYKKDILWVIPAQHTLLSATKNQPANVLPIDKYGGGKFRFPKASLPAFIGDHIEVADFSFIPTPSALDYKFGNSTLTETDYQKTYSPVDDKDDVPFANFVVEQIGGYFNENNSHINFSGRNRQFIINQLSTNTATQNQTLTTSYLCGSKVKIGGESLLCGNGDVTYTTGFAPTIQWSVLKGSHLIDVTSPYNQPQISFTPKTNANGFVKLQAYLSGGGASNTVTKDIWIGSPTAFVTQINDSNYYNQSHFYLSDINDDPIGSEQGITQIKWTKISSSPSAGVILHAGLNATSGWASGPNNGWTMDVKVEMTNSCGTTTQYVTLTPPPAFPCETYSLAKDGTSSDSYAVVHIIEPPCDYNRTVTTKQGDQYNIVIANSMGLIIISKTGDTFDLQSFPAGMYVVNVSKDNETIINQTLIKH